MQATGLIRVLGGMSVWTSISTTINALNLGTPTQKFENNVAAIRLAKELTASGRTASSEEQAILSRYVGWGDSALLRQFTASSEIDQLLTDDEMRAARASSLNAHYTALPVIGAMWDALTYLGLGSTHFRVLDPSAGVGHFKSTMPAALREQAEWTEIELDALSASILKLLHPESKVFAQGFETVDFPNGWFDLAISNVPFGDYGIAKPQPSRSTTQDHSRLLLRQHGCPAASRWNPGVHHVTLHTR